MTGNELKALTDQFPNDWHRRFYDEYKNYVYTIVFNRLRSIAFTEDIEECVSDVFADLLGDESLLFSKDELHGIVGLVAKRRAVDYYRRLTAQRGVYDRVEDIADVQDIEAAAEERELARAVLDRITSLDEPDPSIILMTYYYGMTSSQIGAKLGMKSSAVRKRRSRARERLKELLAEIGIDEKEW